MCLTQGALENCAMSTCNVKVTEQKLHRVCTIFLQFVQVAQFVQFLQFLQFVMTLEQHLREWRVIIIDCTPFDRRPHKP